MHHSIPGGRRSGWTPVLLTIFVCTVAPGSLASETGSITGKVETTTGNAVTDARVTIVELRRSTFVDQDGSYRFDALRPGYYHLQAVSARYGSGVEEVNAGEGETRVDFRLEVTTHSESIVVTAPGGGRGSGEVAVPVTIVDQTRLGEQMRATIGDTLAQEPGVSSTYYGPGSSRPIIRGQSAGRVRMLEGGIAVGDASTTSPDHAVTIDPLSADRVEILRGPATLLYGSTAVGGVVNVMDGRIPDHVPQRKIGGTATLRVGSVADERAGAVTLNGGGGQVAWHVDALKRETDDYEIPGAAVVGDPDSPVGTLPNSALETDSATAGLSWVFGRGYLGASIRRFNTLYGIPVELEEEDPAPPPGAEEEGIQIDMEQRRYDLRGEYNTDFGPFTGVMFRAGFVDYEHVELEGDEIGTTFLREGWEGRVELPNGQGGRINGVTGLQIVDGDLEAIGDEAFVPPSSTRAVSLFAHQEFKSGVMRYEGGLRFESTDITVSSDTLPDRDFTGASASFGLAWVPGEHYAVGFSLSRTERPPSAEELYSDGPHLATFSYELGDPTLDEEISLGADVSLRKRTGRLSGEFNLFLHRYDDYIYERPTGAVIDDLPVFQFMQDDAEFRGVELSGAYELLRREENHLDLVFLADYVRAELVDDGEPLPLIPPWRWGLELRYSGSRWSGSAGFTHHDDQDRAAPFEFAAPSYTMVQATVGYRIVTRGLVQEILLRGSNLTDEEARVATSRLKRFVPLPGRDFSLSYRLVF